MTPWSWSGNVRNRYISRTPHDDSNSKMVVFPMESPTSEKKSQLELFFPKVYILVNKYVTSNMSGIHSPKIPSIFKPQAFGVTLTRSPWWAPPMPGGSPSVVTMGKRRRRSSTPCAWQMVAWRRWNEVIWSVKLVSWPFVVPCFCFFLCYGIWYL